MSGMSQTANDLTIQPGIEGPDLGACPCCGGGRVFGFAYRDGQPLGLYQACEVGLPGSNEAIIGITIGPFDGLSKPAEREVIAFTFPLKGGKRLTPTDRNVPGWSDLDRQGVRIAASAAPAHPRLPEFIALAEAAMAQDVRFLRGLGMGGFVADAPAGSSAA